MEALLFLLLLLLFLGPQNSEQAAAGAAPLLREGEERLGGGVGDVSFSECAVQQEPKLSCSANAPPSGRLQAGRAGPVSSKGTGDEGDGGGVHSASSTLFTTVASVLLSLTCSLTSVVFCCVGALSH